MVPVSVVIITYNEAKNIAACIKRAKLITDDVIIVDSGSRDETLYIAKQLQVKILERTWDGYGNNKNKGIDAALYNWILSIDADELPDHELIEQLHSIDFNNFNSVYGFNFRVYFNSKLIRYGSWGNDHQIRLFNRTHARWSDVPVHEKLIFSAPVTVKRLTGNIHHYSVNSTSEYYAKANKYARLNALKYFEESKKATFIKLYFSPVFNFLKNYMILSGFLDGREGWIIAKTSVWYTWRKYSYLSEMNASESLPALAKK